MKTLFAAFCDELTELDSESFDVKGLQCSLLSDVFPTMPRDLNAIIVLRVFSPEEFSNLDADIEIVAFNQATGERLRIPKGFGHYEFHFYAPFNPDSSPVVQLEIAFNGINFPAPSIYRFDLLLCGSRLASLPLEVRRF